MSRLTNCALVSRPRLADEHARRGLIRARFARLQPKIALLGAAFAALVALLVTGVAIAEGFHSNPWLLSWIPPTCCVTNDCCWEITESEVRPVSGDRWEVLSTGQVLPRSAWSPDGRFYRCACDLAEGKWIKHQGANTRCLFVPLRSVAR
jgi:hypothetical protein